MREITIQVPDKVLDKWDAPTLIGYAGEHLATAILFDLERWLPYMSPTATVNIEVQLPDGKSYLVFEKNMPFCTETDKVLRWEVSSGFLATPGNGFLVISLTSTASVLLDIEDKVLKSAKIPFRVCPSLWTSGAVQPENGPLWYIELEKLRGRIEAAGENLLASIGSYGLCLRDGHLIQISPSEE